MGDLFGGGGGDDGPSGPVQTDRLTPEQKQLLEDLNVLLTGQLGQGLAPFEGEISPGIDPLQQTAFDQLAAIDPNSYKQHDVDRALSQTVKGTPAFTETAESRAQTAQFFLDSFERPAQAQFDVDIDALAHRFGMSGSSLSGSFGKALGQETTNFRTNLSGIKANLLRGDRDAAIQSKENAFGRRLAGVQASGAEELRLPQALFTGGAARRGIEAEQNQDDLFNFMFSQPAFNPWLGYLGVALGVPAYQFSGGTQSGSAGGAGGGLGALGGLLGGGK